MKHPSPMLTFVILVGLSIAFGLNGPAMAIFAYALAGVLLVEQVICKRRNPSCATGDERNRQLEAWVLASGLVAGATAGLLDLSLGVWATLYLFPLALLAVFLVVNLAIRVGR